MAALAAAPLGLPPVLGWSSARSGRALDTTLGKVAVLWEMINWCIQNPLESEAMDADDPRMTAMQAYYIVHERRGVALEPGKH